MKAAEILLPLTEHRRRHIMFTGCIFCIFTCGVKGSCVWKLHQFGFDYLFLGVMWNGLKDSDINLFVQHSVSSRYFNNYRPDCHEISYCYLPVPRGRTLMILVTPLTFLLQPPSGQNLSLVHRKYQNLMGRLPWNLKTHLWLPEESTQDISFSNGQVAMTFGEHFNGPKWINWFDSNDPVAKLW